VGQASRAVTDGTAIGRNAQANATNSTAIGSGATASAANSVQIGQGNNSTAGTVNFGGPSGMRLTNVQNGVVAAGSRDAVNGSQLNSTNIALANERDTREAGDTANAAAIAAETTRATDAEAVLDARIDANANAATAQIAASEARSITASRQSGALAMAVAGMTGAAPTGKGATAISMGVGTYGGETAVAVGVSHAVTDAVRIFGSFTKVSGGDTGAALGGSYSF
jgi:autotransporter adhesin